MSEAHERIKEGLNEALAFVQGQKTAAVIHQVELPSDNIAAINATTTCSKLPSIKPTPSPRA